jgi:hypothetical protein
MKNCGGISLTKANGNKGERITPFAWNFMHKGLILIAFWSRKMPF